MHAACGHARSILSDDAIRRRTALWIHVCNSQELHVATEGRILRMLPSCSVRDFVSRHEEQQLNDWTVLFQDVVTVTTATAISVRMHTTTEARYSVHIFDNEKRTEVCICDVLTERLHVLLSVA